MMALDLLVVGDTLSLEPYHPAEVGWVRQLSDLAPRRLIEVFSIGVRVYGFMQPIAAALATATPRNLMAALGTWDIEFGYWTADLVFQAELIRTDCAARGINFYLWTVPPRATWAAGQNFQRAGFNAYARGLGGCIDADALLRDPGAPNSLSPRFCIQSEPLDDMHPNTAGGRLIAQAALSQMALG